MVNVLNLFYFVQSFLFEDSFNEKMKFINAVFLINISFMQYEQWKNAKKYKRKQENLFVAKAIEAKEWLLLQVKFETLGSIFSQETP